MKLLSKASLAFKKEKPSAKVTFGTNVINALTVALQAKKNATVTASNLPIPVADLQALNDELSAAIADALTGNHAAVANVKNIVQEWNGAFTETANYVTTLAQGDQTIIRNMGFVPTKGETQPTQKPGAITDFTATINGSKGAIIAGSKNAVQGANTIIYSALPPEATVSYNGNTMIITVGGKSVYIIADTHRQTEFCNLPSGLSFSVSAFAVNRAGSGPATVGHEVVTQ